MAIAGERIPVTGIWTRHIAAGHQPLGMPPAGAEGRWQRHAVIGAIYLADEADTAWAELYRACAEHQIPPSALMPRDLWRYRVALRDVVDLRSSQRIAAAGLPAIEPDRSQWPAYQALGERLAADGASGVVYLSAARAGHLVLCVFAPALDAVTPLEHSRVAIVPAPPRGMRT